MSTISSGSMMGTLLANAREVESSQQTGEADERLAADGIVETGESTTEAITCLAAEVVDEEYSEKGLNPAPDDPTRLARIVILAKYAHPDRPTLVVQHNRFLEWDGKYSDVTGDVKHSIAKVVQPEFDRMNRRALAAHAAKLRAMGEAARSKAAEAKANPGPRAAGTGKLAPVDPPEAPRARAVTARKVGDVYAALGSLVSVATAVEMPAFIDESGLVVDGPFPANEAIPLANGIIRPTSAGTVERIDRTPTFLSTSGLPYDYDPQAPDPSTWLRFLEEILTGDEPARALLQEWFGYCLTHDTYVRGGRGPVQGLLPLVGGAGSPAAARQATVRGPAPRGPRRAREVTEAPGRPRQAGDVLPRHRAQP